MRRYAVLLSGVAAALAWCPAQVGAFSSGAWGSLRPALARPHAAARPGLRSVAGPMHKRRAAAGAASITAALDGYDSMLSLDSPAAWAAFLLWSIPLPVAIGAVLRFAEEKGSASAPLDTIEKSTDKPLGEQRNLMWAFPSFSWWVLVRVGKMPTRTYSHTHAQHGRIHDMACCAASCGTLTRSLLSTCPCGKNGVFSSTGLRVNVLALPTRRVPSALPYPAVCLARTHTHVQHKLSFVRSLIIFLSCSHHIQLGRSGMVPQLQIQDRGRAQGLQGRG